MLIDGIISVIVAVPQLVLLPEVPSRLTANFMFSEKEVNIAKARHPKEGNVKQGPITRAQVGFTRYDSRFFS